jgi:voltage-gated potassium channel
VSDGGTPSPTEEPTTADHDLHDTTATSFVPGIESYQRSILLRMSARAFAAAGILLLIYFIVPIENHPHAGIGLRLAVGLALFVAVLTLELGLISRHAQPMLRAAVALATIIPLFLVLFSWIYLTMARSNPASFATPLDRIGALYFTVTVFSTVGFGDITAKTDTARLVVTIQMISDMLVIAVILRLILGAASRTEARRRRDITTTGSSASAPASASETGG